MRTKIRLLFALLLIFSKQPVQASFEEVATFDGALKIIKTFTDKPQNDQLLEAENVLIIFGIEGILTKNSKNRETQWWTVVPCYDVIKNITTLKLDGHPLVFSSPHDSFLNTLGTMFQTGLHILLDLKSNNYPLRRPGFHTLHHPNEFWKEPLASIEKPIVHKTHGLLTSVRFSGEQNIFNHKAFGMLTVYPQLMDTNSEFSKQIQAVILVDHSKTVTDIFLQDMILLKHAGYLPNLIKYQAIKLPDPIE